MVRDNGDEERRVWLEDATEKAKAPSTMDPNVVRPDRENVFIHAPPSLRLRITHTFNNVDQALSKVVDAIGDVIAEMKSRPGAATTVEDITAVSNVREGYEGVYVGGIKVPLTNMHRHVDSSTKQPPKPRDLYTKRGDYAGLASGTEVPQEPPIDGGSDISDCDSHITVRVYILTRAEFACLLCTADWSHRERVPSSSTPRSTSSKQSRTPGSSKSKRRTPQECIIDTILKPDRTDAVFIFRTPSPVPGAGDIIATDPTTVLFTWAFEYGAAELRYFRETSTNVKWCSPVAVATMLKRLTKAKESGILLAPTVPGAKDGQHVYVCPLSDVVAVNTKGGSSKRAKSALQKDRARELLQAAAQGTADQRGRDQQEALQRLQHPQDDAYRQEYTYSVNNTTVSLLGKRPASTLPPPEHLPRSSKTIRMPNSSYSSSSDSDSNSDSGSDTDSDYGRGNAADDPMEGVTASTEDVLDSGMAHGAGGVSYNSILDGVANAGFTPSDLGAHGLEWPDSAPLGDEFEAHLARTLSKSSNAFDTAPSLRPGEDAMEYDIFNPSTPGDLRMGEAPAHEVVSGTASAMVEYAAEGAGHARGQELVGPAPVAHSPAGEHMPSLPYGPARAQAPAATMPDIRDAFQARFTPSLQKFCRRKSASKASNGRLVEALRAAAEAVAASPLG